MTDSFRSHGPSAHATPPPAPPLPPPPAPPLPPQRYANRATSALARLAHPFIYGSRPPSPQPAAQEPTPLTTRRPSSVSLDGPCSTPITTHRTGIPIAALDISPQRTHAVVAGREILKTVRVTSDQCTEETNIRSAVIGYASTHHSSGVLSTKNKDHLAANDVKWSHSEYDRIIATAANNGRIVIYDLSRPGVEFGRFHEHSRQVHRLAFNPHRAAWLLSGSHDATVRMWDLRMLSGDRAVMNIGSKGRFSGYSDAVRDIRWSPSDTVGFATATDSGIIQRWDVRKENAPVMKISAHEKACSSVDWHSDGKHLVSGSVDRQIKVWDFASTNRKQKPSFQLRAPQSIVNARWRPPSWTSGEDQETASWESTQIVTSYDHEDPRIHLWDLRRPHIPCREFDRYNSSATDMLWHSKDILWSVNSEGIFLQTDMNLAPTVVERRPPSSITWSPGGSVLAFAHSRPGRRRSSINLKHRDFMETKPVPIPRRGRGGDDKMIAASQSLTDECTDESTIIPGIRKRSSKAQSKRSSKSLSGTPPMADDELQVVPLEKAVAKNGVVTYSQTGIVGHVSGATFDSEAFRYLAHNYSPLLTEPEKDNVSYDPIQSIIDGFDENAAQAELVNFPRLAQTWRIVKYVVSQELLAQSNEKQINQGKAQSKGGSRIADKSLKNEESLPVKAKSRLFKGVIEAEAQKLTSSDVESGSNATTPLVRPVPDSPLHSTVSKTDLQAAGLADDLGHIKPLPQSVLASGDWPSNVEPKPNTLGSNGNSLSQDQSHDRSVMQTPVRKHRPELTRQGEFTTGTFADQTRSAPRAIARRADWRFEDETTIESSDQLRDEEEDEDEEDYDKKMDEKRAALRDYKMLRKRLLSVDPVSQDSNTRSPVPLNYARHDSAETFPMFSASTDSSQRAKSLSESTSPFANADTSQFEGGAWTAAAERPLQNIPELEASSPPRPGRWKGDDELIDNMSLEDLQPRSGAVNLERPSTPLPFLSESSPLSWLSRTRIPQVQSSTSLHKQGEAITKSTSSEKTKREDITLPLKPMPAENTPWGVQAIVGEMIKHYCSSTSVDLLSATHLLHKMHILFYSCEDILPYEERELIFKTYNELLLRQGMLVEAAELRLLCVPTYPAVYDYAQKDTFINVFCFECDKPYENSEQDNRLCHRCRVPQPPCTICMSRDPPADFYTDESSPHFSPDATSTNTCPTSHYDGVSSNSPIVTHHSPTTTTTTINDSQLENKVNRTTSSQISTKSRPHGSALWSWCQGCGHGAHTVCLTSWLSDVSLSEGGCPTPGCFHDCGPGPRREEHRAVQQEANKRARDLGFGRKSIVKRDSWAAGESKAVETVRGMLGNAASAAAAAARRHVTSSSTVAPAQNEAPPTAAATMSPKKVRLVTPVEQVKRKKR